MRLSSRRDPPATSICCCVSGRVCVDDRRRPGALQSIAQEGRKRFRIHVAILPGGPEFATAILTESTLQRESSCCVHRRLGGWRTPATASTCFPDTLSLVDRAPALSRSTVR